MQKPILFNNILTLEHCDLLKQKFFEFIKENNSQDNILSVDDNNLQLDSPYVKLKILPPKELENFLEDLTKKVSENFECSLMYSHAFLNVFYKNSIVKLQTETNDSMISLFVNVGEIENWALNISNKRSMKPFKFDEFQEIPQYLLVTHKSDYTSYFPTKGSGVAYYGFFPHWRDELICGDEEYVLQISYHWLETK